MATTEVTLCGGILREDGSVVRDVEIREVTPALLRELSEPKFQRNQAAGIKHQIENCVVSFDGERASPSDIGDILVGDRDLLVLEIQKISGHQIYDFQINCPYPSCAQNEAFTFSFDLDNIDLYDLSDIGEEDCFFRIEKVGERSARVFDIPDEETGASVTVRFLEYRDAEALDKISHLNDTARTQQLLLRSFVSYKDSEGDVSTGPFNIDWLDKSGIGVGYLGFISETLALRSPGVDLSGGANCPFCSRHVKFTPKPEDFLASRSKKRRAVGRRLKTRGKSPN